MSRLTWTTLGFLVAAGVATGCYSYRLQTDSTPGYPPQEVSLGLFGLSVVPTGLFAAACLLGRRSVRVHGAVCVGAVLVAFGRIVVMRGELSTHRRSDWDFSFGVESGIAWAIGTGVAALTLGIATIAALARFSEQSRPVRETAGPGAPNET